MKLVATYPILFESHQYAVGDELPMNNQEMKDSWVEAGTAVVVEDEPVAKPKAKRATAQAGLSGDAVGSDSEDGENTVGTVPKTTARKKK